MGLDDLIPDDANSSSSSRSQSNSSSGTQDLHKVFESGKGTKAFTEEQWEDIKTEINQKTEYSVGEVESLPSQERHKVLHELAISANNDYDPEELDCGSDTTCAVCGVDCSTAYVEVQSEPVCINHPIVKVAKELGLELKGDVNDE